MYNQESNHILQEMLNERYQLQKVLSQKAGRQTFLAYDLQTEELVVVKILKFGSDFEWESLKLFEREAQILKALSHPAIPKYLDYFEIDLHDCKGFALVQQYIEAQSLEAHLAEGETFSTLEIQKIAEDCLKILIDLHQQNPPLVHRDLKPSNILLGNRSENGLGKVYLIDFGAVQNQVALGEGTFTVVGLWLHAARAVWWKMCTCF
jgi:serine/threonine protein kinase